MIVAFKWAPATYFIGESVCKFRDAIIVAFVLYLPLLYTYGLPRIRIIDITNSEVGKKNGTEIFVEKSKNEIY